MELLFSQRYKELIRDTSKAGLTQFLDGIDYDIRRKIAGVLLDFREPQIYQPNRYDSFTATTDALISAAERLNEAYEYEAVNFLSGMRSGSWGVDEQNRLGSQSASLVFDLIELLYDELSDAEENGKSDFRAEVNAIFSDNGIPWMLVDGRMVKIDSKQFEQDMKRRAAERLSELKDAAPVFQSSYDELVKAIEFLDKGDFAEAATNAAKSYESALKVLCNEGNVTLDKLTKTATGNGLFKLPDSMKPEGFQSQVLMSLPFIRNRPGAAHGAGAGTGEISRNMANLAVNLACALDTYIADEWAFGQQDDRD